MKIQTITDYQILFDNGNTIAFKDSDGDLLTMNGITPEIRYSPIADFDAIMDHKLINEDFDEELTFLFDEERSGFKFGTKDKMIFVPCYCDRLGYKGRAHNHIWLNIYYPNDKPESIVLYGVFCDPVL